LKKFGYWLLADNRLPVVHYDRCGFDNEKTFMKALFPNLHVKDMQWVNKQKTLLVGQTTQLKQQDENLRDTNLTWAVGFFRVCW
jgi:hypothetical protein